jgi:hypothetical protein
MFFTRVSPEINSTKIIKLLIYYDNRTNVIYL